MLKKLELLTIVPTETCSEFTAYFFQKEDKIVMPLTISLDAFHKLQTLQNSPYPIRPFIHDVFIKTLSLFKNFFVHITIYEYLDNIYYAYLRLEKDGTFYDMDCEVSDAVYLSIRWNRDIFVENSILEKAGVRISKEILQFKEDGAELI